MRAARLSHLCSVHLRAFFSCVRWGEKKGLVGRGVLSAVVGSCRLGVGQSSPGGPSRWPSRDQETGRGPCSRVNSELAFPTLFSRGGLVR